MNFTELKEELADRGFDYLSDTRLGRYINRACAELDELALWPYREKSAVGTAPLTIIDLGVIESVTNEQTNRPIEPADWRTLGETYGDLSTSGSATAYYIAWPAGVPVVATYPTNSDTIGVQYYKVTTELSGTDEPAAPERFHMLIVDIAAREAYRDRDNFQAAEALQVAIDRQIGWMLNALLVTQIQGPDLFTISNSAVDG